MADVETRCEVTRGSFVIPARLLEDGYEADLARHVAQRMPDREASRYRPTMTWSKPDTAGDVVVRWRVVRIVPN